MKEGHKTVCEWSEAVARSLTSVLPDDEFASIASHLNECSECRILAEGGEDENITDGLRDLDQSRKSMPHDLSIPVTKLNSVLTDYEILNEIGRGGMGVVYRAWQIELERPVALKILPGIISAVRSESAARFRREAALAAQLKHSNIISIYDCGQVDGTFYYAMELIQGRSVADVIQSLRLRMKKDSPESRTSIQISADTHGGPPSDVGNPIDAILKNAIAAGSSLSRPLLSKSYFRYVAERIAEVAEALHYAHSNGVIHRDIKPSNLLIAPDGRFMIADFGLAVRPDAGSSMTRQDLVGTYRYMSPESVDKTRGRLDHRADIYALGATLYELLTLRPMLSGTEDQEVLLDILNQDPAPPRRISRHVPRELDLICMKAAAKTPSERYESAKELADDLNRWLLDLPIAARKPSALSRSIKFVRRHRVAVATITTIILALSIAGYVSNDAYRARLGAEQLVRDTREQRVERSLFDALHNFKAGRTNAAIHEISALAEAYPNKIAPSLAYATILFQLDRDDEAVKIARDVAKKYPKCRAAQKLLTGIATDPENRSGTNLTSSHEGTPDSTESADALFLQALVESNKKQATDLLNIALDRDPNHVPSMALRCLLLNDHREYDSMLRDADRVIRFRSDWSFGYGQRAMALHELGQWQDAKRSFDRAIALDHSQILWLVGRSKVNLVFSNTQGAMDDASRALALDSNFDPAYLARAMARSLARDFDGALADFGILIDRNPDAGKYYYRRSQTYRQAGLLDEELADLKTAAALDPQRVDIFMQSGESHLILHDYEQAIDSYSRAIELQPNNRRVRFRRAMAFELAGQSRQALSDYDELGTVPHPLQDYANLARFMLLTKLGRTDQAESAIIAIAGDEDDWVVCLRRFFEKSLSREELLARAQGRPQRCEANYYIARAELLAGKNDAAIESLRNCIALNPGGTLEAEFARLLIKYLKRPRGIDQSASGAAAPSD
ncbi:MAG: protein kinase [Phycisphaerales bacterium]|nr:protein kinase [Phycisphaerales bacterium]